MNTVPRQESVTAPVVGLDPQRLGKSGESRPKYVVISPVRDEGELIGRTIESVIRQSVIPSQWIIVDDGSGDDTGSVIDQFARNYSWITVVHRPDRGFRQPGTGVIDAFYAGYEFIEGPDWEFIVKLDGDLTLDGDYFKNCLNEFHENPKLGIGGGAVGHMVNDAMYIERTPSFHVRGATKIYRRECWDAIGGLLKAPGWDTIDELKANMLGWSTQSFLHLPLLQARPTGATNGIWGNSVKNGRANYITGYHPLFMLLKCVDRARKRPYVVAGLGMMYGYVHGYFTNVPRVQDRALIRYTREQQVRKLLRQDSIWK